MFILAPLDPGGGRHSQGDELLRPDGPSIVFRPKGPRPEGPRAEVRFLGRRQPAPRHQLEGLGERCKLRQQSLGGARGGFIGATLDLVRNNIKYGL